MIRPTGTNVVLEAVEEPIGDGTIHIPDGIREASNRGVVIAMGPKVTDIAIGDKVFIGRYEGKKIQLDGREVRLVPFETIMGIFTE